MVRNTTILEIDSIENIGTLETFSDGSMGLAFLHKTEKHPYVVFFKPDGELEGPPFKLTD